MRRLHWFAGIAIGASVATWAVIGDTGPSREPEGPGEPSERTTYLVASSGDDALGSSTACDHPFLPARPGTSRHFRITGDELVAEVAVTCVDVRPSPRGLAIEWRAHLSMSGLPAASPWFRTSCRPGEGAEIPLELALHAAAVPSGIPHFLVPERLREGDEWQEEGHGPGGLWRQSAAVGSPRTVSLPDGRRAEGVVLSVRDVLINGGEVVEGTSEFVLVEGVGLVGGRIAGYELSLVDAPRY